jgi:hypothetical protein
MLVLDVVYGIWSSMNPVMLAQSWRKLLPDLEEDDFQGFPNKTITKSKISEMVYAMRSSENVNKDNAKEWLQSGKCEMGFQDLTDTDTANNSMRQNKEGRKDET